MFELFPLGVGLIGSLHCMGMCGPLVLAYSLHLKSLSDRSTSNAASFLWKSGILHHLVFHAGRILSYGIVGAVAAGLFQAADVHRLFFDLRSGMSCLGGAILILLGLVLLKVLPLPGFLTSVSLASSSFLGRRLPPLFQSQRLRSKAALGMAVALVPCCLSWAMIVTAASTQSPTRGFVTMVLFGAGTVPALFFTGLTATFLSRGIRFLGEKAAALSIVAMGVILIFKGAGILA